MSEEKKVSAPKSLADDELATERRVGRRSVLRTLSAGMFTGAAATVLSGCFGHSSGSSGGVVASGISDGDSGSCADPANHGWGNTGLTDGDSGTCADPAQRGRNTGLTDSDSGQYADASGRGRRGS